MDKKGVVLLIILGFIGCSGPLPASITIGSQSDADKILSWHFSEEGYANGLEISGRVDEKLQLVVTQNYFSNRSENLDCEQYSIELGYPVGLERSIILNVKSGFEFRLPILLDYKNPSDRLSEECEWSYVNTNFIVRDNESGNVLHDFTLIPYDSMSGFYKAKALPERIDVSCSLMKIQVMTPHIPVGICQTQLDKTYGWYFGVPKDSITRFDQHSVLNDPFSSQFRIEVKTVE